MVGTLDTETNYEHNLRIWIYLWLNKSTAVNFVETSWLVELSWPKQVNFLWDTGHPPQREAAHAVLTFLYNKYICLSKYASL